MAHDFVYFYAFNCIMVSVLLVFISLRFCSNCITYGLCSNCLVQNWILQQLHYPFRFCSNCITKLSISHYLPPHGWAVIVTLVTCQLSSQSSTQQTNAAMALHRGHPSIIGRVFASAIIGRRCQVAMTIIGLVGPTVTWGAHLVLATTTTTTTTPTSWWTTDYSIPSFFVFKLLACLRLLWGGCGLTCGGGRRVSSLRRPTKLWDDTGREA